MSSDASTTCNETITEQCGMQMSDLTKQKHEKKVQKITKSTTKINKFKNWNKEDTRKFFRTLELFGTDFYMINFLFKDRTRTQLKRKFKKERNSMELANSLTRRSKFLRLKERMGQAQFKNEKIDSNFVRRRFESLASVDSLDIQLVEELRQLE